MAIIDTDILQAKLLLEHGELVAIPTETVYGLAGSAYNEAAVLNIFKVKKRPSFDPLIVHTNCIERIRACVTDFNPIALTLANYFWPGPLTLLLKKNKQISDIVTSGSPYVGVRIPQHPLTQILLASLSFPLAAPSANPFGYISPTTATHVNDQLGTSIPYILDGGSCTIGIESTIIGFENEKPILYRLGGISVTMIEKVIGPITIALQSAPLQSIPGTLTSHYSPKKQLKIGDIRTLLAENNNKRIGILSFDQTYPEINKDLQIVLSSKRNLDEAAVHLFAALRKLDQMPIDLIIASHVSESGIGLAINDRLTRASNTQLH